MKKIRHIAKALALIMTLVLLAQSGQMVFAAESFHVETESVLNSERTEAADGNASGQASDVSLLDDKDAPADKACMDEEAALVSVSETEEETDSAGQQKADASDQNRIADTNDAACNDGIKAGDDAPEETPDAPSITESEQEVVPGTDAYGQVQYNNTPIIGSGNSGGVTVNVNAPAGSFPEGTTLSVVPMDESETGNLISGLSDVAAAAAFNITFTDADGNTVQPAEGKTVEVTFTNEANFDMSGGKEICIYHFGDNGLEKLASQTVSQPGSNSSISVQAASFSPYIEVYTLGSETSTEETANGNARRNAGELNENLITGEASFDGVHATATVSKNSVPSATKISIEKQPDGQSDEEMFSILLKDDEGNTVTLPAGGNISIQLIIDEDAWIRYGGQKDDCISLFCEGKILKTSSGLEPGSSAVINAEAEQTGNFSLKLRKIFQRPSIEVYNFKKDRIPVMVEYYSGPDTQLLNKLGYCPDNVLPGESVPIDLYAATEVQLLEGNSWYNTPYRQNEYKQIRIQYTVNADRSINVTKESGDGFVEYDRESNTIRVYMASRELELDKPQLCNSDYDNSWSGSGGMYDGFRPHYYSFTPKESGRYSFFSSGNENGADTYGVIVDENGNVINSGKAFDNDSGGNKNFAIRNVYLKAGTTYYLGATLNDFNTHGDYYITVTKDQESDPSSIQQKPEGYLTLHVKKKWEGDETHPDSISVHLSPALGQSNDIVLNERNNWEGDFADLPLYDASGKEIEYSVSETTVDGYTASYSSATETSRKDYWVMVNAPEELENGRKYVIAAQDWGQAIYYNNPNTYYFLKESDSGYNGLIGLHRIEHANTVFTGPKTGNGTPELVLGGKAYDEYLDPDSSTTQELAANEMWLLGKQGSLWMLQNEETSERMTLKGENNWWVYWNPHVYSFVCSNEDGWHADENVNYSQLLDITDANDGMARISSRQEWGNYGTDTRYLYLNLTSYAQTTGAVDNADHAGQFKFFTPITEVKQTITITNTTDDQVTIPVMKKWVGPEKEQVTVMLLADGVKKQSAVLTREDSWKTTFSNLPKYDSLDGHETVYSISEIPVDGYSSVISGTARDGYTITNTIAGKISIPVTKVWSGGTGSKAVVHLFADGNEIARQELNAGCQWQHTFENLDKYKDGKEISYTLTEDGIPGYSSAITYSAERGFTVTNTKDPDGHHDGGGHGGDHGNGSGTGAVGLYKVDTQTGAYLAGAQFALYRSDGTCIGTYTTDSNGYLKVQNLAYGSYYFTEIKAPENYALDTAYIRFTLDKAHSTGNAYPWNIKVSNTKSGVKTITVGGTKTWEENNNGTGGQRTVPSAGTKVSRSVVTGDDSHMMLYLFLMIGSLIVLAADLVFLRRHKEAGK